MKFHSIPIEEHAEVPLGDDGRWEDLVEHWSERQSEPRAHGDAGTRCFVLSVVRRDDAVAARSQFEEITGLIEALGDRVVGSVSTSLVKPDPRTLIRKGVAERIAAEAKAAGAELLVVDAALSASQTRNLEETVGLPISDREKVILDVFEKHATTQRARTQVEIARLEYLRPRIRGIGLSMDQQVGGFTTARGPGEKASELLARRLDGRLAELRRRLSALKRSDSAQRKHRQGCARVALVGYTNAGKTSLMNALTCAGLSARDRPFETLDTTSRALTRHGGDVLLSDTVGFIRRLPEHLLASFESTLAEVAEATHLLLVADISDPEVAEHLRITEAMLERLGAHHIPRTVVFNKSDRLEEPVTAAWLRELAGDQPHVLLSSHDEAAVAALRAALLEAVRAHHSEKVVFVPYDQPELIGRIHATCRVIETTATPTGTQLTIAGEPHVVDAIARAARRKR